MKNLSDNFKPSSTFIDIDKSEKISGVEARPFQLNDFLKDVSDKNRSFTFDSEHARNFDQENINKAKQGVKELFADAIAKAKTQAVEIKNQALKEGKSTGHEEGFQAGFEEGKNKAKEEFDPLVETLNDLILNLSQLRKVMYPKVENEMIGMIVDLTKKVLHRDMNLREDSVKEMILLAMNSVVNKENMVIRIHPSDIKNVENFLPELKSLFSEIKNVNFEAHSGVKRGGCIIETNFGTIDAGIDQLDEQIEKILNFTPTVPDANSTSKVLVDNTQETVTEEETKTPADTISTSEASKALGEETLANESLKTETEKTIDTPNESTSEQDPPDLKE